MKRLDMSIILSVCFLIILFIAGCPKVQQPKLEDAEAYTSRGLAYLYKGQYDQAISDCNRAIEINPRNIETLNIRGDAYRFKGQYDKAISDFNKAIEISYEAATLSRISSFSPMS